MSLLIAGTSFDQLRDSINDDETHNESSLASSDTDRLRSKAVKKELRLIERKNTKGRDDLERV